MTDSPNARDQASDTTTIPMTIGQLHQHLLSGEIVLPRFQRTIVWKRDKREDLIASIQQRLPIGALLVHQTTQHEETKYVLVDGLQRTIAIREYMQNPLGYMHLSSLDQDIVADLRAEVRELPRAEDAQPLEDRDIDIQLQSWIRQVKGLEADEGLNSEELCASLKKGLRLQATYEGMADLRTKGRALITAVRKATKIDAYPLAVVQYKGPRGRLAEIFKNINTKGAQLDRFDAYAADWADYGAFIRNRKIKSVIDARWNAIRKTKLQVEDWSEAGPTQGYSFWEYMYGLGILLATEHPFLFGSAGVSREEGTPTTQSAPFYVAAVAHGLPPTIEGVSRLPSKLLENGLTDPIDLSKFEDALLESCKFVDSVMNPSGGMKLNAQDDVSGLYQISQLQVFSLVSRALVGRYEPFTWAERDNRVWSEDRASLSKNMPLQYLLDVLQGKWSSAGDSKLYAATWEAAVEEAEEAEEGEIIEAEEEPSQLVPSSLMTRQVAAEDIDAVVTVWLRDQLARSQQAQRNIQKDTKLVLRYLYKDIQRDWHEEFTFHIDHLLPVTRLAELVRPPDRWPISAIGNLALLDSETNLQKLEKTMPEYLAYLESVDPDKLELKRPLLEYSVISPIADGRILRAASGKDAMSRDQYLDFLRERHRWIKWKLMKVLGFAAPPPTDAAVTPDALTPEAPVEAPAAEGGLN